MANEKTLPAMTAEQLNDLVNSAVAKALQQAGGNGTAPVINVVLDPKQLALAMVQGQKQVGEEAVVLFKEEKSRAERRKQIEKDIEAFDNRDLAPYLAYSTEICPHTAPTVGGLDFPKFIIKRGGPSGQDTAAKKLVWLTKREAERALRFAAEKWMELVELDEVGNPVLDARTGQPRTKRVPYNTFIRLVPTRVNSDNKGVDDPAELVASLEAELAAYRAGGNPANLGMPVTATETTKALDEVNVKLKGAKLEARKAEDEAEARFAEELKKPSITGVRR